mmetsp:Transcript_40445/g.38931  ORF Transcript_40445/g.38931 Transcript_40445/m.38931 type:complete len:173 (+) Transcript_40445:516-1034(+)
MREREQKMVEVFKVLEERKHSTKKKSLKIKSLRKERDMMRLELLKLKQQYSDKCDIQKIIISNQYEKQQYWDKCMRNYLEGYDNYKEVRQKMQKRLKKREEKICYLEQKVIKYEEYYKKQVQHQPQQILPEWALDENLQDLDQSSQFMKSSIRSKSLENTGNFNSTAKNFFA